MRKKMGKADRFIGWSVDALNEYLDELLGHCEAQDIVYSVKADYLFADYELEGGE
jgi:hypothetical protein